MLCLSIPTPGFPHFYYILGANFRDFSVLGVITFTITCMYQHQVLLIGRFANSCLTFSEDEK